MLETSTPLLDTINSPADLRQLSQAALPPLAEEIRRYLIASLNACGGHFASSLGTVELTIALHYLLNTPDDALIWDVGHQAYVHKLLTGRQTQLASIRQTNGLAPFPAREESEFDAFGVGHSSTSISAALGMSIAAKAQGLATKQVAVIGDGAITAGMAFEALNHAGALKADMLVILNDNNMSISENVGALSTHLSRLMSSRLYSTLKESSKKVLSHIPPILALAKRGEAQMKGMVTPSNLFEALGFNYLGPVDGHDLSGLLSVLKNVLHLPGPQLLHVITQKGKGYQPAETDPIKYHAVKPGFYTSKPTQSQKTTPTYSEVFGQWLCDMAHQDPRLMAITPAMREGSGMVEFSKQFPERYFDVAIAEQHAVTFAAGLACGGNKPVVAIYSTFLQRAYDQLIHDVALQNLPVLFALDRAGIVGGDGATHQGNFDLSYLNAIPNLTIMAPADENECRQMLYSGFLLEGPCAVRYPRGTGPGVAIEETMSTIPYGKADIRRRGQGIALLAFGRLLNAALDVGESLNATVVNMRFVKPLDEALLTSLAQQYSLLVTLEENVLRGGAGSAVNDYLAQQNLQVQILNLGIADKFIPHGEPATLLSQAGLDAKGIKQAIKDFQAEPTY